MVWRLRTGSHAQSGAREAERRDRAYRSAAGDERETRVRGCIARGQLAGGVRGFRQERDGAVGDAGTEDRLEARLKRDRGAEAALRFPASPPRVSAKAAFAQLASGNASTIA